MITDSRAGEPWLPAATIGIDAPAAHTAANRVVAQFANVPYSASQKVKCDAVRDSPIGAFSAVTPPAAVAVTRRRSSWPGYPGIFRE